MQIDKRRWIATLYRCPGCGSQTARTQAPPTPRWLLYRPDCSNWRCERNWKAMEVVERRYYTTFAIEYAVSATTVAGTLKSIGPFDVCQIVHPTVRHFRRWIAMRKTELAEEHRQYMEEWKRREALGKAKRQQMLADYQAGLEAENAAALAWLESLDPDHPF